MRGHENRLKRLSSSIPEPEMITLLIEYADGRREEDLPLDVVIAAEAERVMIVNGDTVLMDWLPADCWAAI